MGALANADFDAEAPFKAGFAALALLACAPLLPWIVNSKTGYVHFRGLGTEARYVVVISALIAGLALWTVLRDRGVAFTIVIAGSWATVSGLWQFFLFADILASKYAMRPGSGLYLGIVGAAGAALCFGYLAVRLWKAPVYGVIQAGIGWAGFNFFALHVAGYTDRICESLFKFVPRGIGL